MIIHDDNQLRLLRDARNHLYVAVLQSLKTDDQTIMGHVRDALHELDEVLGGSYPEQTKTMLEKKNG
jgi:hypothetical protein